MKVIIDRFEGDFALCEQPDGAMTRMLRTILPVWAREGDVLQVEGSNVSVDREATEARRQETEDMIRDIRE
jgi:hypothetical protein